MKYWLSILGIGLAVACLAQSYSPVRRSVRLSAVFDPTTIDGLQFWIRSDSLVYSDAGSTLATDGDHVQEWHDKTGNGHNFIRTSSFDLSPTNRTGILNGYSGVQFDGSGENLPVTEFSHGSNYTFFAVIELANFGPSVEYIISRGTAHGIVVYDFGTPTTLLRLNSAYHDLTGTDYQSTESVLITIRRNLNAASCWTNGVLASTNLTLPAAVGHLTSALNISNSGLDFEGYMFEIIGYTNALADADVTEANTGIMSRYALP